MKRPPSDANAASTTNAATPSRRLNRKCSRSALRNSGEPNTLPGSCRLLGEEKRRRAIVESSTHVENGHHRSDGDNGGRCGPCQTNEDKGPRKAPTPGRGTQVHPGSGA